MAEQQLALAQISRVEEMGDVRRELIQQQVNIQFKLFEEEGNKLVRSQDELRTKIEKSNEKNEKLKAEQGGINLALSQSEEKVNARMDKLEKKEQDIQQKHKELESRVNTMSEKCNETFTRQDQLTGAIESLQKADNEIQHKLHKMENNQEDNKEKQSRMEQFSQELVRSHEDLKQRLHIFYLLLTIVAAFTIYIFLNLRQRNPTTSPPHASGNYLS